ncbi:hypothetical protein I7I53_10256 [Histoplasma capsulatum var. duboisii H88]|uniref:Uncharacterized protein n=1 Tax=Ajellomyces capsulatus (strain H88) TaxID=544711 RepID=A0A8A1L846_AJEC8|nr:hypothetical protein I7I53_10256 [Histoplasma capsulatum var. duboisii H88]
MIHDSKIQSDLVQTIPRFISTAFIDGSHPSANGGSIQFGRMNSKTFDLIQRAQERVSLKW